MNGQDVFAWLIEQADAKWPVTRWSVTPTGGWHLWFTAPHGVRLRNTKGHLGPMIDTRAAGGYIVAPPSVLDERAYPEDPVSAALVTGGKPYEWADERPPAPLPDWLVRGLQPAPPAPRGRAPARGAGDAPARLQGLLDHVRAGQPGDRNGRVYWAACRLAEMISAGEATSADAELIVGAALAAGLRGGESEARQTIQSALRSGAVL